MKKLIVAAIAAVTIASPVQAAPQWIQVSADETMFANFNTVRGTGNVRSIVVGVFLSNTTDAFVLHTDCKGWQSSVTYEGRTASWKPIPPKSAAEAVANLVCPSASTAAYKF